jgi:hypothetical protein
MYGSVATLRENSVISNVVYFISRGIGHSPDGNRNLPAPPLLGWGGGLFLVDSNATLDNNLIVGNAVEGTGGDARGGGLFLASSDATLRGNLISGNTVDRGLGAEGGGLYFSGSDATLDGNTIYGNDADYGGGLNFSGSDVTLDGNTIRGNSAGYGGGLYLWRSDVGLQNDVIAGNQADSRGSGLYIRGKSLRMVHTTIARNTGGDGSGVYVTGDGYPPQPGNVILSNTILVSHGVGLMVTAGSTATLEATLWGNGTDWAGEGTIYTGTVNLWGAPAFRKPNAGNYHVGPGSAALDQGVDLGVLSDIDRQPRPYLAPDLGADEYWPPGVLSRLYLPFVLKDR